MRTHIPATLALICAAALASCRARQTIMVTSTSADTSGPTFNQITTSTKSFSKDCVPTSITVLANITDPSGVRRAVLWYRVGPDQQYTRMDMAASGGSYSATVQALDVPGKGYGVWEFYITAEDGAGNQSQSPRDTSVELLLCVSH